MSGSAYPLEPSRTEMQEIADAALEQAITFIGGLSGAPAQHEWPLADGRLDLDRLLRPPSEQGETIQPLLSLIESAAAMGVETAGPGYLGWIPGGGLFDAAVGEFLAQVLNRYVTLSDIAPRLAALEHSVGRWLAQLCGMPSTGVGVLTSGGSLANFSAVVTAREALIGEDIHLATLYTTAHTHQSVAKAARLAGIPPANVRVVANTPDLRMDPDAAAGLIASDRAAGLRPFLIVGSAGTANTGAIDPLPAIAELAQREGLGSTSTPRTAGSSSSLLVERSGSPAWTSRIRLRSTHTRASSCPTARELLSCVMPPHCVRRTPSRVTISKISNPPTCYRTWPNWDQSSRASAAGCGCGSRCTSTACQRSVRRSTKSSTSPNSSTTGW